VITANGPADSTGVTERLQDPDPFALPRNITQRVRCCTRSGCGTAEEVTYLWIDLSAPAPQHESLGLGLEDWLNVVDEAASLGVSWLVFSVEDSPSQFPLVWEITRWAQDTYGMVAGFHTRTGALSDRDILALKELDFNKCHVFVAQEHLAQLAALKEQGLNIHIANPNHEHRDSLCAMPGNMVFVKPDGALYTCGMVKENRDYLLGNIMDRKLNHVVRDPSLPHAVPEQAIEDEHGCDGCPPLVARHIHGK
jgi:radical SAM protein with 4Fe4S-binding SPASM domain